MAATELPSCKNCLRFTAAPYLHSFSASLDQCKNQSWQTSNNGWIVTPTSSEGGTAALAESAFCSGDCLFSYLFSHDLISNQRPDEALHFFKRVDTSRPDVRPADGRRSSVVQSPPPLGAQTSPMASMDDSALLDSALQLQPRQKSNTLPGLTPRGGLFADFI
tara:strand:- start:1848 stop:2336 length:489 start_codon:yes stop_codon:yes gene_type:complete